MQDDLKLLDVAIHRFRGFTGHDRPPLRFGDVTVLVGANGHGKTSVFDAIDWALFGDEWRWAGADTDVTRGLRRPDEVPAVTLRFKNDAAHTLIRDGARVTWDGAPFQPGILCRNLDVFARSGELVRALRGVTYLPQENLRALVGSTQESHRHSLLATLAGVPFADRFEKNLRNTSADLDSRRRTADKDLAQVIARKVELRQQLNELRAGNGSTTEVLASVSAFVGQPGIDVLIAEDAVARRLLELKRTEQSMVTRATESRRLARLLEETIAVDGESRVSVSRVSREREESKGRLTTALEAEGQLLEERARGLQLLQELGQSAAESRAELEKAEELLSYQRLILRGRAAVGASSTRVEARAASIAEHQTLLMTASLAAVTATEHAEVLRRRVMQATDRKSTLMRKAELEAQLSAVEAKRLETEEKYRKDVESVSGAQGQEHLSEARVGELRALLLESLEDAERVGRIIGELLSVQAADDAKCLVCGHDHGDGEARAGAMRRQLKHAAEVTELTNALAKAEAEAAGNSKYARLAERRAQETSLQLSTLADERTQLAAQLEVLVVRLAEQFEDATPLDYLAQELQKATSLAEIARVTVESAEQRHDAAKMAAVVEAEAHQETLREYETLLRDPRANVSEVSEDVLGRLRQMADSVATELNTAHGTAAANANRQTGLGLEVTRLRQELAALDGALQSELTRVEELGRQQATLLQQIENLGVEVVADPVKVVVSLGDLAAKSGEEARLSREESAIGQALQGPLSGLKASSRLQVLEGEYADLVATEVSAKRRSTGVRAAQVRLDEIAAVVSRAIADSAGSAIKDAEARINEVLAELCPHQHLNVMQLAQDGTLRATDERSSYEVKPEFYGSTGQLGCMGLAVFLGIALGQSWSRLRVLMLDEPVQNMDDVNFVRFLDLIRRLAETHQIIVSTADKNIGELLSRKLRLWADGRTKTALIHRFDEFDVEKGPTIRTEELNLLRAVAG